MATRDSANKPFYIVDKFLGCAELETFGTWYGWFGFISGIITGVLCVLGSIYFVIVGEMIGFGFLIIAAIIMALMVWISWELIQGVKTRDHTRVVRFRNFCLGMLVLTVLNIASAASKTGQQNNLYIQQGPGSGSNLVSSLIGLAIQVYCLICIHSLYKKLEEETLPRTNVPMIPTNGPNDQNLLPQK